MAAVAELQWDRQPEYHTDSWVESWADTADEMLCIKSFLYFPRVFGSLFNGCAACRCPPLLEPCIRKSPLIVFFGFHLAVCMNFTSASM